MPLLQQLEKISARLGPGTGVSAGIVGAVLLVLGFAFAAASWEGTRGQIRATATVTENVSTLARWGGILYTPRLRFRTPDGKLVTVSDIGSDEIDLATGEQVPVMYRSGSPEQARVATVWRIYKVAILLAILGTLLFDLGLAIGFLAKRSVAVRA